MRRTASRLLGASMVVVTVACAFATISLGVASASRSASNRGKSTTFEPGDRYVSLGSSLASGFGIANQSTPCGRSDRSYGPLVAAKFGLELVDVSCGAAVVPNVIDTPQGQNPPQLEAVTPDTKLITIGLGGNDIGYNGTALACGDPTTVCSAPPNLAADSAALAAKLDAMLAAVKAKAPQAKIVLVTYPREFPKTNCAELSLADDELALLQQMGATVEKALVAAARKSHVLLVDPYAARGDHTACAAESKRWTAGYKPTDGFSYHPTALGHQVMAKMIIKKVRA